MRGRVNVAGSSFHEDFLPIEALALLPQSMYLNENLFAQEVLGLCSWLLFFSKILGMAMSALSGCKAYICLSLQFQVSGVLTVGR
jgi:hypothetical protein